MPLNSQQQSGFTVMEALVALAILTGLTASVLSLMATNHAAQIQSRAHLTAAIQARALIERVGRDIPLKTGTVTGISGGGRPWSITIQNFTDKTEPPNPRIHPLFEIAVNVSSAENVKASELRTIIRDAHD
ncbi:PulJ/GspJ family protein [Microvirga terricola]|uniref:General secretion pathway protein I n=1 Tax=Microvirga terricola TaxID=2719797 RepID=A0ABX0VHL7_9HYPH|nr:hypothetical protein [Microvirga terricola]NIX78435.1 hypothetical protein [Microvirga terricola]